MPPSINGHSFQVAPSSLMPTPWTTTGGKTCTLFQAKGKKRNKIKYHDILVLDTRAGCYRVLLRRGVANHSYSSCAALPLPKKNPATIIKTTGGSTHECRNTHPVRSLVPPPLLAFLQFNNPRREGLANTTFLGSFFTHGSIDTDPLILLGPPPQRVDSHYFFANSSPFLFPFPLLFTISFLN